MEVGAPWKISGLFDAETTVSIMTADDWEICEIAPVEDEWTPEEIARVEMMRAAPQMLEALRAIRQICHSRSSYVHARLRRINDIAETAIGDAIANTTGGRPDTTDP
jgi:hypothetical protein